MSPIDERKNAFLIFRLGEAIHVDVRSTRNYPKFFWFLRGIEQRSRALRKSIPVVLSTDDKDRAWQLPNVLNWGNVVDRKMKPPFRKRHKKHPSKPARELKFETETSIDRIAHGYP